jgi:rRNA-processing protein FCF1
MQKILKRYRLFKNFLHDVFVEYYGWLPPSPIQLLIADAMQEALDPNIPDTIIQAYRGCGKSSIEQVFGVWCLLIKPTLNILVTSETANLATKFVEQMRRIIDGVEVCKYLTPDSDQVDQATRFFVAPNRKSKDPSVEARPISGQITGFRADLILPDDNETSSNSSTHVQREKIEAVFNEYTAILKPQGKVIALGTPHNEDSVYNRLEAKGYRIVAFPAIFPSLDKISLYGDRLHPYYLEQLTKNPDLAGTAADPQRLDDEDLAKRKIKMGLAGFELQYNLNTTLSDVEKYPLKLKDLIVHDCDMQYAPIRILWSNAQERKLKHLQSVGMGGDVFYAPLTPSTEVLEYDSTIMFIDPSGRGKDETAVAIVSALQGKVFLRKMAGFQDGYSETTLEAIAKLAKQYKVNLIRTEQNYGGGMFASLLRTAINKTYPVMVEDAAVSNQMRKEARVLAILEPVMQQHRLVVDTQIILDDLNKIADERRKGNNNPTQYSLFYQMTRLCNIKGALAHDDRIDSLAGAVGYFTEAMAIDDELSLSDKLKDNEEKELQKDIEMLEQIGVTLSMNQKYQKWI